MPHAQASAHSGPSCNTGRRSRQATSPATHAVATHAAPAQRKSRAGCATRSLRSVRSPSPTHRAAAPGITSRHPPWPHAGASAAREAAAVRSRTHTPPLLSSPAPSASCRILPMRPPPPAQRRCPRPVGRPTAGSPRRRRRQGMPTPSLPGCPWPPRCTGAGTARRPPPTPLGMALQFGCRRCWLQLALLTSALHNTSPAGKSLPRYDVQGWVTS